MILCPSAAHLALAGLALPCSASRIERARFSQGVGRRNKRSSHRSRAALAVCERSVWLVSEVWCRVAARCYAMVSVFAHRRSRRREAPRSGHASEPDVLVCAWAALPLRAGLQSYMVNEQSCPMVLLVLQASDCKLACCSRLGMFDAPEKKKLTTGAAGA